jgi:hypothetical protein
MPALSPIAARDARPVTAPARRRSGQRKDPSTRQRIILSPRGGFANAGTIPDLPRGTARRMASGMTVTRAASAAVEAFDTA